MNIYQVAIGEVRLPVERGGGADNFIFRLSHHLAKRGHRVTLLDRRHLPSDAEEEYLNGLRIVRLKARKYSLAFLHQTAPSLQPLLTSALNQAHFAWRARSYLSLVEDAEVVHIHSSPFLLPFSSDTRLRAKLFYTSHTPRRLLDSPRLSDRLALTLENRLLGRVSRVIVLNSSVRDRVSKAARIDLEDVAVLPVAVDPQEFRPDLNPGDIEERYGMKGKTPLLFVGRIRGAKGVDHLLEAMKILVHRWGYREVLLLLVGPVEEFGLEGRVRTPYLERILTLIRGWRLEDNVRLTGLISGDNLKRLYAACSIFILPSLSEATPTAVLEAMACAKPVVATRVGGIPEQVEEGKSGFMVPPGDAEALVERIKYLLDHPREAREMGAYGRRLVEERFTWEHIVDQLVKIYIKPLQ